MTAYEKITYAHDKLKVMEAEEKRLIKEIEKNYSSFLQITEQASSIKVMCKLMNKPLHIKENWQNCEEVQPFYTQLAKLGSTIFEDQLQLNEIRQEIKKLKRQYLSSIG